MCSLFLPRCTEDIKGPYLPCRGVCYQFATDCQDIIHAKGLQWTAAMCDILPEKDNPATTKGYRERCFTPPNFIKDSGIKYKQNCSNIVIEDCKNIPGFTKTVVSENVQRRFANYMKSKINWNASDTCSPLRKEIVCAENLPACIDGAAGFLCRDKCLNFFNNCKSPFFYGKDMCIEFPKRENTPSELSICKQTHWPRSENWFPETSTTPATSSVFTTKQLGTPRTATGKTDLTKTDEKPATDLIKTSEKPTADSHSPVAGIRGQQKGKKSGSNKLLIGLVVTFLFVVLIVAAVVVFVWYRRKKNRQFDYQKQVLYYEDKVDELEVFT